MKPVCLTTVGAVDPAVPEFIGREVVQAFGLPTFRAPDLPEPDYAWDARRRQYSSPLILSAVPDASAPGALRVIALTERDLYIPMLSFIYGQAQLDGAAGIVSLARLRQEFYGLPGDWDLLFERARKEVVHELGHTFGLVHCVEKGCVMTLSTNIRQLDLKHSSFCADCSVLLSEGVRRANSQRMEGQG